MVKKAASAPVQEVAPSEFTDLATLRRHFKLSYAAVTKGLTDAGLKPVHSQPIGKGVMAFYNKKAAFTIFEEKAAEKQKALEEKDRKAAEQALKLRTTTASDTVSPEVLSSVVGAIAELTARISLQQDVTSKQFELLGMKIGTMEKALTGSTEKPVNVPKEVVDAIKPIVTDSLTASSSSMRRLREENEKGFAIQATAIEAGFIRACSQLDTLLSRVEHLTTVVGTLENTILAIATTPSVSLVSGEANKAQDFFRKSTATAADHQVTEVQSEKNGKGYVPVGAGENPSRVLKAQTADVSKNPPSHDSGAGAGESRGKPRVLILGLHDNKVRHIDSFNSKLDMTIFNPDEATTRMSQTPPKADYTIQMIDYISHTVSNKIAIGSENILVGGGLSKLRGELTKIVKKHQTA